MLHLLGFLSIFDLNNYNLYLNVVTSYTATVKKKKRKGFTHNFQYVKLPLPLLYVCSTATDMAAYMIWYGA